MKLKGDRIYILPTRFGLYFLGVIFLLFVMALSFGNPLALAASAFFAAMAMTSAVYTHFNLDKIVLKGINSPMAIFSEETALLNITFENQATEKRYNLKSYIPKQDRSKSLDISSNSTDELSLPILFSKRGVYNISQIGLESDFPFGIFRAWRYYDYRLPLEVAPAPKGTQPLPHEHGIKEIEAERKSNLSAREGNTSLTTAIMYLEIIIEISTGRPMLGKKGF